eukprot:766496-Hanusia_phi.AAC.3
MLSLPALLLYLYHPPLPVLCSMSKRVRTIRTGYWHWGHSRRDGLSRARGGFYSGAQASQGPAQALSNVGSRRCRAQRPLGVSQGRRVISAVTVVIVTLPSQPRQTPRYVLQDRRRAIESTHPPP